jgi:hypothetical protein
MEGFDNFGEDDEVRISIKESEPYRVPGQSPLDEIDVVAARMRRWLTYGAIAVAAAAAIYFVLRMGGVL